MASRLNSTWRAMETVAMRKIAVEYFTAAAGPTSHSPPPIDVAAITAPGPITFIRFRRPKGGGAGRSVTSQGGRHPWAEGRLAGSGPAATGAATSALARHVRVLAPDHRAEHARGEQAVRRLRHDVVREHHE